MRAEGSSSCFHRRPNEVAIASKTLQRQSKPEIDRWLSDVISEQRTSDPDAPQLHSLEESDHSESGSASVRQSTPGIPDIRAPMSSRGRDVNLAARAVVASDTNGANSAAVMAAGKAAPLHTSNSDFTSNKHRTLPAVKPKSHVGPFQPLQSLAAARREAETWSSRHVPEAGQYSTQHPSARIVRDVDVQRDSFDTPSSRPVYQYPDSSNTMRVDREAAHRTQGAARSSVMHEALPTVAEASHRHQSPTFEREMSTESYLELPPPLMHHFDKDHLHLNRGDNNIASTHVFSNRRRAVLADLQSESPDAYHRSAGPVSRPIYQHNHIRNTALHGIGSDGIPVIRTTPQRSDQRDPLKPLLGGANSAALRNLHSMNQHAAQQSVGKAGPQLMKPLSRDVAPPIRRPGTAMQTISGQRMLTYRKSSRIEAIKAMKNVRIGGIGI